METLPLPNRDPEKRTVSRALRTVLITSVLMAIGLIILLVVASANTALFERHYATLLWMNIALAVVLFLLVLELIRRLAKRYRTGEFGTRLTVRLAISFIVMTIVPSLLIYTISVQVLGRSLDSWFDVPVERALDSGLNLGRASLDAQIADLNNKARRIETELSENPLSQWPELLDKLRDNYLVQDVLVMTVSGRVIVNSGGQYSKLLPDFPPPAALRQARATKQFSAIEGGEGSDKSLRVRTLRIMGVTGVTGTLGAGIGDEARVLQLIQAVPSALAENAEAVQRGMRDYQELSLARQGLKRIYRVTLTLALVLTLFSAIAAAFLLSGWLTGPLTMLVAGTKAVAEGDYRPMRDYRGRDELSALSDSFNSMTRQLDDARVQVQSQRDELLEANIKLESVLANINAGVLVFDGDFRLILTNAGCNDFFGDDWQQYIGKPLEDLPFVAQFADLIRDKFEQLHASGISIADAFWQHQAEVSVTPDDAANRINGTNGRAWLLKGARLPGPAGEEAGFLMMLDDVSDLVSAQRAVAWSEVARRLAHEIKNPLTPIQLAAERLDHKLSNRLDAADADLLKRSTKTIVNQVSALKQMVDEFRDYARLPTAKIGPVNLGEIMQEVLALYPDGLAGIAINQHIDWAVPNILGDVIQLRQIIHNLVKNAAEAVEGCPDPTIHIVIEAIRNESSRGGRLDQRRSEVNDDKNISDVTKIVSMVDGVDRRRADVTGVRLLVRDNGPGFASKLAGRAFEPYVTTKVKGTGLGLAIVKKIVDDHGALIDLGKSVDAERAGENNLGTHRSGAQSSGAQVSILFTRLQDKRVLANQTIA